MDFNLVDTVQPTGGAVVKNPPANARDMGSIPGLGRSPGEGFLPAESHGQRSLVHYSP